MGKTTVAAGLAAHHASRGGRAVLVEFGDGEAGRRALAAVSREVEHVVVHPDEALRRGAAPLFGSAVLARIALDNFAMRPLLRAAPRCARWRSSSRCARSSRRGPTRG